jgi:hypothetical protein
MRMKIELDEGGAIEFVPKYTRPLDYAMLLPDADKTGKIYDIQFLSESVSIPANNMQGKDQGLLTLRGVNFQEPLKVFALVEGGWLPPPFVYPSNLLVDRNVLSSLQRVKSGHGRHDQQSTDWWMQFFQEGTPIINPLLCALEGHQRRPLSFDEFRGAFEKASADAIALFPGASVVKYDLVRFKTAYRIISDLSERTSNEIDFLVKTAPLISVRAPDSRLSRIESEILEVARALRLDLISLPVLVSTKTMMVPVFLQHAALLNLVHYTQRRTRTMQSRI